jgi:flagellar hook-associated protein 2
MSSGPTFSGLATGIDSTSIIRSLLTLERRPIDRLEASKATLGSQRNKLQSLSGKLQALSDAAKALANRDTSVPSTVTSSDESVVRVTSRGAPTVGDTKVVVTKLATAERTYSDAFAASDQAGLFGTGTLSLSVGGTSVDVEVTSSDTLTTLASKIDASSAPVGASVVYDGTSYRLRVTGDETGASNGITFTEGAGLTLGLANPANERQAAGNATFTVDGLTMTRSTNVVDDAVPGVRLTLLSATDAGATANVSVKRDDASFITRLQRLVDTYNDVNRTINAENAAPAAGSRRGADSLSGDSTVRAIQSRLRSAVTSPVTAAPESHQSLAKLGISAGRDGTLTLDRTKLEAALASSPSAVSKFLDGDTATGAEGFVTRMTSLLDTFIASPDGALTSRVRSLEGRSKDIDKQIDRLETRLTKTEEQLKNQYATLERVVSGLQAQGTQMMSALGPLTPR